MHLIILYSSKQSYNYGSIYSDNQLDVGVAWSLNNHEIYKWQKDLTYMYVSLGMLTWANIVHKSGVSSLSFHRAWIINFFHRLLSEWVSEEESCFQPSGNLAYKVVGHLELLWQLAQLFDVDSRNLANNFLCKFKNVH